MSYSQVPFNKSTTTRECSCGNPNCPYFKLDKWQSQQKCGGSKEYSCPCCSCCSCESSRGTRLGSIHVRLEVANPVNITHQQAILFDEIVTRAGEDIFYDSKTGEFCLEPSGTYLVNWDVSVEGSYQSSSIRFAVLADGLVKGDSTLPVSVGQLSGTCLVKVGKCATFVKLVNDTNDMVQLSRFAPVANLTIAKISN